VSIWLDDLSRASIVSGHLEDLIATQNVVGITTNPTIFANALGGTSAYDAQLKRLAADGVSAEEAAFDITTSDVIEAADILRPIHTRTHGLDGWVSLEVSAKSARDAEATIAEARRITAKVARPNVFVKIPATAESLPAITAATAEGISVNVTLIFSLDRYRQVIDAYLAGLEQALTSGRNLHDIHSVASFFVSRVDVAVDAELADAPEWRGRAGIANARLAYEIFEQTFATARAKRLLGAGANVQRPLWASTGVKDPSLPDTHYVVELVASGVVNTMPERTLLAVADHAELRGNTVADGYDDARAVLGELERRGVDLRSITDALERQGIATFVASGQKLVETIEAAWR
jgi:transaldolase